MGKKGPIAIRKTVVNNEEWYNKNDVYKWLTTSAEAMSNPSTAHVVRVIRDVLDGAS